MKVGNRKFLLLKAELQFRLDVGTASCRKHVFLETDMQPQGYKVSVRVCTIRLCVCVCMCVCVCLCDTDTDTVTVSVSVCVLRTDLIPNRCCCTLNNFSFSFLAHNPIAVCLYCTVNIRLTPSLAQVVTTDHLRVSVI